MISGTIITRFWELVFRRELEGVSAVCVGTQDIRFTSLGAPRRVWAISAIHGELDRLYALHDALFQRLKPGDRIVYLGNYTGYSNKSRDTIDELLTFRRLALSVPGMMSSDIVYLRGKQEDMWQKLIQLQFARNPEQDFYEMMGFGLAATLESYGIDTRDGMRAVKEGVLGLTRWTNKIRETLRKNRGHDTLMVHYRRAAFTGCEGRKPLLFVNSGVDPARILEDQEDRLWNDGENFTNITQPYAPFEKVIRGYDPLHHGVRLNCVTASLDGGSGFGGNLVCAGMDAYGKMFEMLEA